MSGTKGVVLSDDGIAYAMQGAGGGGLELIRVPQAVRMVACNETAVLLATDQGFVFSQGSDPENCGFLGGAGNSDRPTPLEGFADARITQIGLGKTHAAALDSKTYVEEGRLWTWGYGPSGQLGRSSEFPQPRPTLVDSANVFTSKTLICGSQVTSVITSGGFLYLFGSLGGHGSVSAVTESLRHLRNSFSRSLSAAISASKPVSLPGLQNKFVVAAAAGSGFLSVLTDTGEVYFFDDCLDVVRLPTQSSSKVTAIGAYATGLYGLATVDRLLYQWTEPDVSPLTRNLMQTLSSAGHCQLLAWSGKTFSIASQYSSVVLRANGSEIAVMVDTYTESRAFAYLLCELTPYRRSQYISNLMQGFYDSLGKWKNASQQPQRENLQPFISRASPIPFNNHDSSDFSLISFDPMHEKSLESAGALADSVHKACLGVAFRKIQSATKEFVREFPLAMLVLPNLIANIRGKVDNRMKVCAMESVGKFGIYARKEQENERIRSQKAKDDMEIERIRTQKCTETLEIDRIRTQKSKETLEIDRIRAQKSKETLEIDRIRTQKCKEESTKALIRVLIAATNSKYRLVIGILFALQVSTRRQNRKRDSLLRLILQKRAMRIRDRVVKSLFIWKTDIVKYYIKADGLKKLAIVLRKKIVRNAFAKTERYQKRIQMQAAKFVAFLSRRGGRVLKMTQNRYFTRWKDTTTRKRLYFQRRLGLLTSGARAFTSRFKMFLRKNLFRGVISRIKSGENRRIFLSKLKYPLVFLEMKIKKVHRRMCNFAFNRIFQSQKQPKSAKYREILTELQSICIRQLRPAFNELSRDSDSSYIQMVVLLVPFVSLLSKKMQIEVKQCWGRLAECGSEDRDYDIDTLKSWEQPPDTPQSDGVRVESAATYESELAYGRTPSPQKASLRIPSISTISPQVQQTPPGVATERGKYHRATVSGKMYGGGKAVDDKPPWKRPSAAVSFTAKSQVFSPRCRRAQYAKDLKDRITRQKGGDVQVQGYKSLSRDPTRTLSPEFQRIPDSSTCTPSHLLCKNPRAAHRDSQDISGFSSVYALSTIASPRDGSSPMRDRSRGRQQSRYNVRGVIQAYQNLIFSACFRAFAGLKAFSGHENQLKPPQRLNNPWKRSDEDLEVDWHNRIYLIGSERMRRLLREKVAGRLREGWQRLAG